MGQRTRILAQILGCRGWKVTESWFEDVAGRRVVRRRAGAKPAPARLVFAVKRHRVARCADCGAIAGRVHAHLAARRWRDLPWADHVVEIEYPPDRVDCRRCGGCGVEMLAWADPHQRQTHRFQQYLALQAASMPVDHVAAMYGLDWSTVRRAEGAALARWDRERPVPALHHVGLDEKYLGRRNKLDHDFVTIVSNTATGEPIWIGPGRKEETVRLWLATLTPDQKAAIVTFTMDMHEPFANAIRSDPALAHAAIVHDPFHVMKRAAEAISEMRKDAFFRAGPEMRRIGRGTRWLVLRAWVRCSAPERERLRKLFSYNSQLARAYQIVEELRDVLHAPDRPSMDLGFDRILRRTEQRRHVHLRKLHDSLQAHRSEILAYGQFKPSTGRVEALNNNWETLVRRARGYRDFDYLLLKLRFMIANPIRDSDGIKRFLALGLQPPKLPVR